MAMPLGFVEDGVDNSTAGNEVLLDTVSDAGGNAWERALKSISGSISW